ncbi:MAG: hypothetical protein FD167_5949, partial [bacterium]
LEARRIEASEKQAQLRVREMEFELQKQTLAAEVNRMRLEHDPSPASPAPSGVDSRPPGKRIDIGLNLVIRYRSHYNKIYGLYNEL